MDNKTALKVLLGMLAIDDLIFSKREAVRAAVKVLKEKVEEDDRKGTD